MVGGPLAAAGGERLPAGIRQHVAARSLPLATRDLRICVSDHGDDVGPVGLADTLAARLFEPHTLGRVLQRGSGAGDGEAAGRGPVSAAGARSPVG
ncbi:hypothetical protein ACL02T_00865 [Pseudonocardia sp. RS010]|uniref:hypothetical protein n=1 Tax=Pseudonocardia sp. RS010 TaxID=3385979 RepID=UPI0039A2732C